MNGRKGVMFVVQHPAHVHQFKYLIKHLFSQNCSVFVKAIDKEITINLLHSMNIEFSLLSNYKSNVLGKIYDVVPQITNISRYVKKNNIGLIISRGNVACCIYSGYSKINHIIFSDSEPVHLDRYLIKMADIIITPDIFKNNYGYKHKRIRSFKEFSYLHPNYFNPDISVLNQLDIKNGEKYFILRFVAWKAHHDVGEKGLSLDKKKKILNEMLNHGKVFISSESELPAELKQYKFPLESHRMHDALAFASLFVGDSQTMTTESAILGTPAIRINSFVGENDMSNFIELEHKYDLIYNFKSYEDSRGKLKELLNKDNIKAEWRLKAKKLIEDKEDLNKIMLTYIKEYISIG